MRLSLEALAVLDAIDRRGSFSGAAAELHRVPSAISYTVRKLERDLDVQVFDRSAAAATLTPAGKRLVEEGRQLLRASGRLEERVRQAATGWETELTVTVDVILPWLPFLDLLGTFEEAGYPTAIRLKRDSLGGTWDAVLSGRADLAVGAANVNPPGSGYGAEYLGTVSMGLAVAPGHPCAALSEPIGEGELGQFRAVAVGDTSLEREPLTINLLAGQEVLVVPDFQAKLEAQRRGLGVGFLPRYLAEPYIRSGELVFKEVAKTPDRHQLFLVWRQEEKGNALQWLLERLREGGVFEDYLEE